MLWIFAETGDALTMIAAGIYAVVAMIALGCERVLKMLEDVRNGRIEIPRATHAREVDGKAQGALV